jgi:hypothetical protein
MNGAIYEYFAYDADGHLWRYVQTVYDSGMFSMPSDYSRVTEAVEFPLKPFA